MSYTETEENQVFCPICKMWVTLDEFDFINDTCIDCSNEEAEEEFNEETEALKDETEWVQKQNIR